MSLDLYACCFRSVTSAQLAVMAATIASGVYRPVTQRVFDPEIAPKITTLIATVGFYQNTGDWLFTSGRCPQKAASGAVCSMSLPELCWGSPLSRPR